MTVNENIKWIQNWLGEKVFPRWLEAGVDPHGGFVESLGRDLKPSSGPRRAMVQGRQIYTFFEGGRMGMLERARARGVVTQAADLLIAKYGQANGAFVHALEGSGAVADPKLDLYAQSFALFGLANAYAAEAKPVYREAALRLLRYLRAERAHANGGFGETLEGKTVYQQNPHMHLFEAVVTWGRVDAAPDWKNLATDLLTLFRERLVDARTGFLAEQFDADWRPLRDGAGRFYFEPGHQYEWSWLLAQAREVFALDGGDLSAQLFAASEKHGLNSADGLVYDEVWSDGQIKKSTSRFWPQAERIKAALVRGDGAAADAAFTALRKFLPDEPTGVWEDTWSGTEFNAIPYKASSPYHIINALSEYVRLRERL